MLALAGERGGALTLILAGVAVSSVATALISLVLSLSENPFAAVEIVFWLLGSLADRSMTHVWLAGPLMLPGMALLLMLGPSLDAMTLGEDAARNLGVDLSRVRYLIVAGTALSVGAATAIVGTIAFVGLVVPHVLRPLVGHAPSRLLPASLLGGAALVLASDIVLRVFTPAASCGSACSPRCSARRSSCGWCSDAIGARAMMLDARDVRVHLAGRPILQRVSCQAQAGRITAVIGPNGAGKSTLLRAMAGLLPLEGGTLVFEGRALRALERTELAAQHRLSAAGADSALAAGRRARRGPRPAAASHGMMPDARDRAAIDAAHADHGHFRPWRIVPSRSSRAENARVCWWRGRWRRKAAADRRRADRRPRSGACAGAVRTFQQLAAEGRAVVVALHDLRLAARFCHHVVLLAGSKDLN